MKSFGFEMMRRTWSLWPTLFRATASGLTLVGQDTTHRDDYESNDEYNFISTWYKTFTLESVPRHNIWESAARCERSLMSAHEQSSRRKLERECGRETSNIHL